MAQLKMYWLPGTPIKQYTLPEGFSVSTYRTEADKKAWCDCCRNGHLIADGGGDEEFDRSILDIEDIDPARDVFFIDFHGEHVGTVTAFVNSEDTPAVYTWLPCARIFAEKDLRNISPYSLSTICPKRA